MDGLLTRVSGSSASPPSQPEVIPATKTEKGGAGRPRFQHHSVDEAIDILKNEPDYENLVSVLKFLTLEHPGTSGFNIGLPSPKASQVIQLLVTEIIPNYWDVLKHEDAPSKGPSDLQLLIDCLHNVTGLNAIVTRLQGLIRLHKPHSQEGAGAAATPQIAVLIDALCTVLNGKEAIHMVWTHSVGLESNPVRKKLLQQEVVNLIGGGRIVSLTAEAEEIVRKAGRPNFTCWTANGKQYAEWLARNVVEWVKQAKEEHEQMSCATLVTKCLRLGYQGMTNKQSFLTNIITQLTHRR